MSNRRTSAEEGRASKYPNAKEVKAAFHAYLILAAAAVALSIVTSWALF